MSIRRTIMLLTVPLFLALAVVNGALLYFQEKSEMGQAVGEQALAAAVTGAEFIASMENPRDELADPVRVKALRAAAGQITGLDGLYLVMPGAAPRTLVQPARPWSLEGLSRPAKALAMPAADDATGYHYAIALAPTGNGAFVAARIDAEPMLARMAAIRKAVLLIVLISGIIATVLGWLVARRIVRELEKNRLAIAAIGAGETLRADAGLTIRETRDLADAVRLMEASRKASAERSRRVTAHRDRGRTLDSALAATRDARFAPVSATLAGAAVAARLCGDAPMGSFFALCAQDDRGALVLGRCSGASPQQAFERAGAARNFLGESIAGMSIEDRIATARAAHAIEDVRFIAWSIGDAPSGGTDLLALADAAHTDRTARYAQRHRDAEPAELLDGMNLLLEPSGIFAAVSRA